MKKTAGSLLPLGIALFALAARAATASLPVTPDDLAAAGVPNAVAVAPDHERFQPPMRYFRIGETLSPADAKLDCADCGNLVAIYAADSLAVPSWVSEPRAQFVKVGGRLQVRAYIQDKKRIVTVTAPSEATARKISAALIAKFSK